MNYLKEYELAINRYEAACRERERMNRICERLFEDLVKAHHKLSLHAGRSSK